MVVNTLREWKLKCPKGDLNLVFPNGRGNVENLTNIVRRGFRPLQVRLGIADDDGKARYNFHALRHAAASLFIEQGWNPKKIQSVIGHANIATTYDIYGHLFGDTEADREAMKRV